jgi:hypothetical protein
VHLGQRPRRLPRRVQRRPARHRRARLQVEGVEHLALVGHLPDEEAAEGAQHVVVAVLAGGGAPLGQPGRHQRAGTESDLRAAVAERLAGAGRNERVEHRLQPAIGRRQRLGLARPGQLVERHRDPGVANDVVAGAHGVLLAVVLVHVATIVALGPLDPIAGGGRPGDEVLG